MCLVATRENATYEGNYGDNDDDDENDDSIGRGEMGKGR